VARRGLDTPATSSLTQRMIGRIMTSKTISKQEPLRSAKARRVRGGQGQRGREMARFGPANCAYGVPAEHLTELAQYIDALITALHASESPDLEKASAITSRLMGDTRYAAAKPALRAIQGHVTARRVAEARELP
jgi:hypothetical protein